MTTGRIIRSDIFKDRKVKKLSTLAQLLYTWSLVGADREGRINADPGYLKLTIAQNVIASKDDIWQCTIEWAQEKLGMLYQDENGEYFQFSNFKKMQRMENDQGLTSLYTREAQSLFPGPASCKIIAGELHCSTVNKQSTNSQQTVDKQLGPTSAGDFVDEIKAHGHSPESYKRMNANEVLLFISSWLKKNGKDVMLPAGSMDWDKIPGEIRGIAKYIGQIVTPIRLPMILSYIRDQKGFIYGPCSPFVLKLVKQWNKDNIEAVEGL